MKFFCNEFFDELNRYSIREKYGLELRRRRKINQKDINEKERLTIRC